VTTTPTLSGMLQIHRGTLIAIAAIGLVLGIVALVLPGASLLTVAIVFGSYLVASGIFRIVAAFAVGTLGVQQRWITGILGLIVVIAGVLCLADPFTSLVALAFLIGIGWIAEGAVDIVAAVRGTITPRWFGWVSGVLAVLAGIAAFVMPGVALTLFVTIAAILLIVVSLSTLLTLPRTAR
jgi:uncharacterized membrane protein HdeD (DUF308 family)